MDVEELSMIGPVVDLASVDSIHRKRILAFVNHFIINTASFLNRLSCTVEGKLLQVDHRLQKLEASIILLESKLTSIPGLDVSLPQKQPEVVELKSEESPVVETKQEEVVEKPVLDDELLKYVKMTQVGVPVPAVKLKMQAEGISPEKQDLVLSQLKM